jgi:hypothetical protein
LIKTPTVVFYGTNDFLADPNDIQKLIQTMGGTIINSYEISSFAHMDFTWSYLAAQYVYPKLLQEIN